MTISEGQKKPRGGRRKRREEPDEPVIITPELALARRAVDAHAAGARAESTREDYAKQWQAFSDWCDDHQLCELPASPQALAMYLSARADEGRKVATLAQALAAISLAHVEAGYESPRAHALVRETWKGIRRRLGVAQDQKRPVSIKELRAMVDELPPGLMGLRDRALITLGFAGGFRRSELVALDVADVAFVDEGLEALVRRSKTDQEGHGLLKVIAYGSDPALCPVRTLKDWLELAVIVEGPLFRPFDRHGNMHERRLTSHAVAVIVKRTAVKVGLPAEMFSGHSLRAGFVTEAKKNGADDAAIMDQTGHKSLAMVHRYHRRTKKWEKPASAKLGL